MSSLMSPWFALHLWGLPRIRGVRWSSFAASLDRMMTARGITHAANIRLLVPIRHHALTRGTDLVSLLNLTNIHYGFPTESHSQ